MKQKHGVNVQCEPRKISKVLLSHLGFLKSLVSAVLYSVKALLHEAYRAVAIDRDPAVATTNINLYRSITKQVGGPADCRRSDRGDRLAEEFNELHFHNNRLAAPGAELANAVV